MHTESNAVVVPSTRSWRAPARIGVAGALALAGLYAGVIGLASGRAHLADQLRADWYWLVLILAGFGVQLALIVQLRRRQRAHHAAAGAGGVGAGASALGMLACCAHHVVDLAPFLGAAGAAAFLLEYRVGLMLLGVAVNAVGIVVSLRRLRLVPPAPIEEHQPCVVASS